MTDPVRRADIGGIIFDKDGTLFDFHTTWADWTRDLLDALAAEHGASADTLARAVDFDLAAGRFLPSSPLIGATSGEGAALLAAAIPGADAQRIEDQIRLTSADAPLAPAVPLAPFLTGLAARGLKLGLVTNDTEYGARAHLGSAGVLDHFDFIAGYDTGHGAKPEAGALLAFAKAMGMAPRDVAMVGDSTHDLIAGRAGGMHTLGVLTGIAETPELAPYADAVLPDIGHIPAWLDGA
ncbi:phosphatase [Pelagivirga sediminicola]|uniref:phosphoglycolate phosphatase n=1 Tax=Pelagivirga sediminicola TaxID=2170575 RepID=A0A2T7G4G9_9RHOB|nr:HAD family hydrolase [Pelagivirga sediminicola]PVA09280.1 phosphatase [Pelagivirga sediminicola]